ncbi:hypothetical protein QMA02_14140 [Bacillus wiedmannii]|uniref:hypothetical protein n=1 Tax=Bacillus cereus group TaxID=86661 RepID=UPI0024AE1583|nr:MULTISPECIES: hypothetical protein [Bacillus cereus group]MDI6676981.1 hypothetical protein [Bacillus wiedmannii]
MNINWIQTLANWKIHYHNETEKEIEYSGAIDPKKILALINEFSDALNNPSFSCSFDDTFFNLPKELEELESYVDVLFENTIQLTINLKKIYILDSNCSPYTYNLLIYSSIDAFLLDAKKLSLEEVQSFLFNNKDYTYIYIFNENIDTFNNEQIIVSSVFNPEYPMEYFKNPDTESVIKLRDNNVHWHQGAPKITPSHLFIEIPTHQKLKNFFDSWCAILCIGFLSAYTDIHSSGYKNIYLSTFRGKKHIRMYLKMPDNWNNENVQLLYQLYEWAYEEKTTDKISMIQNIVSLYIAEETLDDIGNVLENINQIKTIIHDNFQIYIKENIKTYLDERKKIEDLINNTINEITKQVNNVTDLMTKNLIGILASVLTAIVAFIAKPDTLSILAIALYMYSVFILLLTIYYGLFAKINVNLTMSDYTNRLNDYKIIFEKNRLTQIIGDSISRRISFFNKYFWVTMISNILFSLIAVFIGLHLQGYSSAIIKFLFSILKFL